MQGRPLPTNKKGSLVPHKPGFHMIVAIAENFVLRSSDWLGFHLINVDILTCPQYLKQNREHREHKNEY